MPPKILYLNYLDQHICKDAIKQRNMIYKVVHKRINLLVILLEFSPKRVISATIMLIIRIKTA